MALIGSLDTGVSALDNFSQGLDVISDNIANVNTVGFKSSTTNFADTFSNVLQASAPAAAGTTASNTTATQIGMGSTIGSITADYSEGTLQSTGVPTDLAITGNGFFNVRDPVSGNSFGTRAGDFQLDNSGNVVTSNGMRLQGLTGGTISFAATDVNGQLTYSPTTTPPSTVGDLNVNYNVAIGSGVTNNTNGAFTDAQVAAGAPALTSYAIGADGSVNLSLSNGDTFVTGQVMLQNFQDPNALIRQGNNLLSGQQAAGLIGGTGLTAANNTPGSSGLGQIQAGNLETSNADLTTQMSDLITMQRSFQAASSIVTVSNSILNTIVGLTQ